GALPSSTSRVTSTACTAPYSFAVLDRIAGPAWVLVRALRENAARKPWARHEVVEVDGARALVMDERGEPFYVRCEEPLEPGVVFLRPEPLTESIEPYRHAHVLARVTAHETLAERRERKRGIVTAALGLLSGFGWIFGPCTGFIAAALSG
ncbi:MAG TPA: hypothetical protein VIL20_04145, partial [Sandaracinaceae bacterium]